MLAGLMLLILGFEVLGLLVVIFTRLFTPRKLVVSTLSVVNGTAGLTICFLPFWLVITGQTHYGFALVGNSGGLIGVAGALLSFLETGRPHQGYRNMGRRPMDTINEFLESKIQKSGIPDSAMEKTKIVRNDT